MSHTRRRETRASAGTSRKRDRPPGRVAVASSHDLRVRRIGVTCRVARATSGDVGPGHGCEAGASHSLRTRFVGDKVLLLLAISRFPQEARPSAVPRHRLAVAGRGGGGGRTPPVCARRIASRPIVRAGLRSWHTRRRGGPTRPHTGTRQTARHRRRAAGPQAALGETLLAGEHVIVLTEGGDVVLVFATLARHEELARVPVLDGRTWNHPVVAEGRLLVRNLREMAAFDP